MAKGFSTALKAHMRGEVTTVCTCWQILRQDGTAFYFTDHDQDIIFESNTYRASVGYTRSAISANSDMSIDNLEIQGMFDDSTITNEDLQSGLFDFAEVFLFLVNWMDLTMGAGPLRTGNLGDVQGLPSGIFTTQLNGLISILNHNIGDLYQPTCRSDVGDGKCMVPIKPQQWSASLAVGTDTTQAANYVRPLAFTTNAHALAIFVCTTPGTTGSSEPSWNYTVGATTSDGTAVWTSLQPWMVLATVAAVTDQQNFKITYTEARAVDGWFTDGEVTFLTGNNAGRSLEIKNWVNATAIVTLFLPFSGTIQVGDTLTIYPGCDKTRLGINGCKVKFNNIINRQAEDFVPGTAYLIQGPSSVQ